MKRLFDFIVSGLLLILISPVLLPVMILVFLQDFHSPFYLGMRAGKGEQPFKMVKLRSMAVDADRTGVDSTSANDNRITPIGRLIRGYKLDELMQLWNVFLGDMSLTGPRPNVLRETNVYTRDEKRLLSVRPGITDLASIIFSDEGEILEGAEDPDLLYNQIIRPWKSRLALFHLDHQSMILDLRVLWLTATALVSKSAARAGVQSLLKELHAPQELLTVSSRMGPLPAAPPPGATRVVTDRNAMPI